MTNPNVNFQQPAPKADTCTESMQGFNGWAEYEAKQQQPAVTAYDLDTSSMRGHYAQPAPKR